MKTTPTPASAMPIPIPLELHQQLLLASIQSGFTQEVWEIGAAAIRDWLARNAPESFAMPVTSGYQWKHVFLPEGTVLRTVFNGKNFHAHVEGDQILYERAAITPSRFANAVGGVRRNAWKVIWVLLPNAPTWKLADALRPQRAATRAKERTRSTPLANQRKRRR